MRPLVRFLLLTHCDMWQAVTAAGLWLSEFGIAYSARAIRVLEKWEAGE